jgi:ribonucleoside-diphosphate reductase alpha subunit
MIETVNDMRVTKRDGKLENIAFDKIVNRIKKLGNEANIKLNYSSLTMKVIDQLYDTISTAEIDELTAQQCAVMASHNPDYNVLAGRVVISNHQKNTRSTFFEVVSSLYTHKNNTTNEHEPICSHELFITAQKNADIIEEMIDYDRDYLIDYFGFKTLERAYLFKINNQMVERPQHMWMRVALCLHGNDMTLVKETYELMSQKYFTHATPTLFNAGTDRPQMSSCYLIAMEGDSLEGIFNTLKDCASISKWAGGIGLHIHNIRGNNSLIKGTNGKSTGIVPMLKVFNDTARFINQGGKRNGSFAIYLEPWHSDIEDFLDMKKNHGDEEMRARDLFYGLWIPDLFMERVKTNQDWCLFCPNECPNLSDTCGEQFKELYIKYENSNLQRKTLKARDLWFKILDSQMETGNPYLLYKDACNLKSNQQNLGTIKSSNLCCEIVEYSDSNETAVCNLASIALPSFIKSTSNPFSSVEVYTKDNCNWCVLLKDLLKRKNIEYIEHKLTNQEEIDTFKNKWNVTTVPQLIDNNNLIGGFTETIDILRDQFDYEKLHKVTKVVTNNLNRVIDINFYPTSKTKVSNIKHRPIGIGIQGLADTFILMDIPFHSDKAKEVNKLIFETIYHASLEKSNEIAIDRYYLGNNDIHDFNFMQYFNEYEKPLINTPYKGAYSSFRGSPASQGKLQFDMWGVTPSDRYDWDKLKKSITDFGLRNSLLVAPMPTASTSQILGFNECFEPLTSNIYSRRTLAGEFVMANKYLMKDLISIDLWNQKIKDNIIANKGSIQQIDTIPQFIRDKYKVVWEMPMKHLIDMAADRGAFICQSQSLNLWIEDPNYNILTSMHFYSWSKGLKTGIYYLRRKAKHQAQQFTLEPTNIKNKEEKEDEPCEMCSA